MNGVKQLRAGPLFAVGVWLPMGLVACAVVLSQFFHVAACPLCVAQRMLYLVIASISAIGFFSSSHAMRAIAALLGAASAVIGVVIAGYQIYLQRHPFTATCGDGTAWWELMIEHAGKVLPILFKADGFCSDNAMNILGLSIVDWSLLAFSGLLILCILCLIASLSRSQPEPA